MYTLQNIMFLTIPHVVHNPFLFVTTHDLYHEQHPFVHTTTDPCAYFV